MREEDTMDVDFEKSCPYLASRWNREARGDTASEDNACYLWEESGVPPDVVEYGGGLSRWHGEPYVPVSVEMQYSICLREHYGGCRWLREQRWHAREARLVCPMLGAADDRSHKYFYPTVKNFCHGDAGNSNGPRRRLRRLLDILRGKTARAEGGRLPPETQRRVCLTEGFGECNLYQATRTRKGR